MRPTHLLHYGYTPTHPRIVEALAIALRPVGEGTVRLLDPCAGTGEALAALARALRARGARVETYGVEIEANRAAEAARVLDHVIHDDWRKVALTERSISLALLNPPYDNVGGEASLEREIIRRAMEKIAPEGVAIFVVPRRLLEWLSAFHMQWLALRTSPDPESPTQVILVGIRQPGEGRQPLPGEQPLEEGFPEIPVPALRSPAPAFYKVMLEPEDIAEALEEGPDPLDLLPEAGGGEIRPLHPLRPGHRAAVLAAWSQTLHLPGPRSIRVVLHQAIETQVEEDEEGRTIRRTTMRPAMAFWALDPEGLSRRPFEELTRHAREIDQALRVQARVEEGPDGWPRTEPREEEVLRQIGERLPAMGGRKGLLPAQAVRAVGMARALLGGERAVFGVMEMGYGKTPISLTVLALVKARRRAPLAVVMCPPHLVPKWEREIRRLFPESRVVVPEGTGVERVQQIREAVEEARAGREIFVVLSREAAKLGPLHRPALVPRLFPGHGWRWACPHCGHPAHTAPLPRDTAVWTILESTRTFPAPPPSARARLEERAAAWRKRAEALQAELEAMRARGDPAGSLEEGARRLTRWQRLAREMQRLARLADLVEEALRADPEPPERFLDHSCAHCGRPYAAPTAHPRRWPLAEILAREARRHRVPVFLIVDEAHEYRHASLQGRAFARLLRAARWAVLLTGTPFGGKASELFRLLRSTSPELRRQGLDEIGFVRAFGAAERVEVLDDRRKYGRRVVQARWIERPGISPAVLRFLISRTAFGSLQDVAAALPEYQERQETLRPDFPIPVVLHPNQAGRVFQEHGMGGLMVWLQAALGYMNVAATRPADGDDHIYDWVQVDPDGRAVARHVLLRLPVIEGPVAKERWLVDFVRREREAGRRVVVLVQQTGRRPLADRLVEVLRKAGLQAGFLDPARVPPAEREEWILRNAPRLDALVVHPRAVETGLDLIMFQTVVVYEVVYSAVTLLQAVRRVWRLGQDRPVRVVSLAHEGSLEELAWDLVAKKISWATSVYGDFVASGLGAGEDPALDILQALAQSLKEQRGELRLPAPDGAVERVTLAGLQIPTPAPAPALTPAPAPATPASRPGNGNGQALALDPALARLPLFAALRRPAAPRRPVAEPEPLPDLSSLRQGRLF